MKKYKNLLVCVIIILIISAMLLLSFFLEKIIKNEASNIEQNRFLEEMSVIVNDLNIDSIKENLAFNNYEVYKGGEIIAYIYLIEENGLNGKVLIEVVFLIENENVRIYDYTVLECNEKDKKYMDKVLNDENFKNEIINTNIIGEINVDIVSGASISSNLIINAINESIILIKEVLNNEK